MMEITFVCPKPKKWAKLYLACIALMRIFKIFIYLAVQVLVVACYSFDQHEVSFS